MLFFGHIGIGKTLTSPWHKNFPLKWLILGTILPDIIDKPLYYGLSFLTGRHGADIGLISGTRTFGHSGLFLLVFLVGAAVGSRKSFAIAAGMMTHFLLDWIGDLPDWGDRSATVKAFFFPLFNGSFGAAPFLTLREHLLSKASAYVIGGEIVGVILLLLAWRRDRWSVKSQPSH